MPIPRSLKAVAASAALLGLAACGKAAETPAAPAADVAADSPAVAAVKTRQAGLKELGKAFKGVNEELKKSQPDMAVFTAAAPILTSASKAQYDWFPAGSGPEAGVKTEALPVIWSEPDNFASHQKDFEAAAAGFAEAVASGDAAAIAAKTKAVGATCGGCHKVFRED